MYGLKNKKYTQSKSNLLAKNVYLYINIYLG